jgi:hypothetical protein
MKFKDYVSETKMKGDRTECEGCGELTRIKDMREADTDSGRLLLCPECQKKAHRF